MKYDEITPTLSEGQSGDLYTDILYWYDSAKSVDQIIGLVRKKYNIDDTVDDAQIKAEIHKAIMSNDEDESMLNEVKMSTNIFDQFINSPEAEGIAAGFEAELYFQNIGEPDYDYDSDNREEDYSEDRSPRSIDDIKSFFYDYDYNTRRDVENLVETLETEFYEWQSEQMANTWDNVQEEEVRKYIQENDFVFDDELEEYMSDTLGLDEEQIKAALLVGPGLDRVSSSEQSSLFDKDNEAVAHYTEAVDAVTSLLDERVEDSIRFQDRSYDSAREEWEEENRDEYSERDWLEGAYDTMQDVYREHDIQWPYWSDPEIRKPGYSLENATDLANTLTAELGVKTIASSYYHEHERKPGLWIFEPDGSLTSADDENDMPVEIISPPMPLKETLEILPKFYAWAKSHDAYSNDTTGFHVGVSLPDVGGEVDYMKLALFLGDKYVLDKFERYGNSYCKSAFKKIRDEVTKGDVGDLKIARVFDKMKSGLIEMANEIISDGRGSGHGHGKMTSLNMKGKYVEFRSMGNEHYFSKPKSLANILDTIKRYAYAMYIAGNPELYRDEYAKKLYKLLDKDGDNAAILKEFSDYVTAIGGADIKTVKDFMTTNRADRYNDAKLPDRQSATRTGYRPTGAKYWWNVQWDKNRRMEVVASNKREAREVAAKEWGVPVDQLAVAQVTHIRPFKDSPGGVGNWKIMANGQQLFRFMASTQGEANELANDWLTDRSPAWREAHRGRPGFTGFSVVPV